MPIRNEEGNNGLEPRILEPLKIIPEKIAITAPKDRRSSHFGKGIIRNHPSYSCFFCLFEISLIYFLFKISKILKYQKINIFKNLAMPKISCRNFKFLKMWLPKKKLKKKKEKRKGSHKEISICKMPGKGTEILKLTNL